MRTATGNGTAAGPSPRRVLDRALLEPMSAQTVAELAVLRPEELDGDLTVALVEAWERADAWLQAQKQHALAAVAGATASLGLDRDAAGFEVAAALRLCPDSAAHRAFVAGELTGRLTATLAALERGDLAYLQAQMIADGVAGLDDEAARRVERRVLDRAGSLSYSETRRLVRRAVLAADPAAADELARRARARRTVDTMPLSDGQAMLTATGPAAAVETIYTALTATGSRLSSVRRRVFNGTATRDEVAQVLGKDVLAEAAAGSDDGAAGDDWDGFAPAPDELLRAAQAMLEPTDRGMDACRFDALEALAATALADPKVPTHQHTRPAVQVRIDLATLLGLADNPAELVGHGAIPPQVARELALGGDWVRFVTDPLTGALLDMGRRVYRPTPALARFVVHRDRACTFPGCGANASRCDIDHLTEFDDGGATDRKNLAPHCRRHHNAKTHGRWRVKRLDDGGVVWTSPLGQSIAVHPRRFLDTDDEGPDDEGDPYG